MHKLSLLLAGAAIGILVGLGFLVKPLTMLLVTIAFVPAM